MSAKKARHGGKNWHTTVP